MNYSELNYEIHGHLERLGWSSDHQRQYLLSNFGKRALSLLTNDQMIIFRNYLRSQQPQQSQRLQVTIDAGLFDQIERYLERQAANADGEASRLLMELEDLEIDRTAKQEGLIKQE